MSSVVKIAFIGAGNMAKEHMRAFADIPGVVLAGIVSRSREKVEALCGLYPSLKAYQTIDELYTETVADIVVVAVPELAMKNICQQVFRYKWLCLFEKPVGYNLSEAEEIVDFASANNTKAFVALNRRHYYSTQQVFKQLDDSSPRIIQVLDQESPKAMLQAGKDPLLVKNWMFANSIHLIDYFTFLGRGAITKVDTIVPWEPENPFFVSAKISYSSGDTGIYNAVWDAPGPWSVTITTRNASFEMRPLETLSVQLKGSRNKEVMESSRWDKDFKPGLRSQAAQLLAAFQGGKHELPTIYDALESMKLVNAIYAQ